MDGKRHLRHRNVASRAFTPRMVALLTERARRYADEAIDALAGRRSAEFVTELAVPVPMRIIADMIGIADGDLALFRQWSDAMISGTDASAGVDHVARAAALVGELKDYVRAQVEARRARPQDDILTRIVKAGDEGLLRDVPEGMEAESRFDSDEIVDMCLFLLMAGNETTRNAISQGMLALFEHPDQRRRLADDPTLWATAADEILRWTSPVRAMRRVALVDTELSGQKIRQGDSVVMVYASANRDDSVFDAPHAFRVDRSPNDHLAFGFGPHRCLGTNLARMEIAVTLERVLARLPDLRLAGEPVPTPSALIDGLLALPVEW
ncbi:MAG: cytochrome P450 [Myxococcota bacterium]